MSGGYSGKEVVRALRKIGFSIDHQRGSHLFMHNPEKNVSIVVPYHKEIKKGTLNNIVKKVGITFNDLKKLV